MQSYFIKGIQVNQVRHLNNIFIALSDTEKKHLLITGKNGSGETTLLSNLRNYYISQLQSWPYRPENLNNAHFNYLNGVNGIKHQMRQQGENINNHQDTYVATEPYIIEAYNKAKKEAENLLAYTIELMNYNRSPIEVYYTSEPYSGYDISGSTIAQLYNSKQYVIQYFEAKRSNFVGNPRGIVNIDQQSYAIMNRANISFLQYIVNLKTEQAFAKDENDFQTALKIDNWFTKFTNQLRDLYGEPGLNLRFDRKNYNFLIDLPNRQPSDFNSMSDGYSAILSIATEIMMRMPEDQENYTVQGVVMIDEIETHLHIDLQKKVLPFLTSFFPNIQSIVTTHSPFVLNSISNSVVYDLEKKLRLEDLSGYSMEGIVESYFQQDKYSEEVKSKIIEFEELALNKSKTEEEHEKYNFLKRYFKELPKYYSPELEAKLQQIQLDSL